MLYYKQDSVNSFFAAKFRVEAIARAWFVEETF